MFMGLVAVQMAACSGGFGAYAGPGRIGPRPLGVSEFFRGFADAGVVTGNSMGSIKKLTVRIDSLLPESLHGLKLKLENLEILTLTGEPSKDADLSAILYTVLSIYAGVGKIRKLTLHSITLSALPDPLILSAFSALQSLALKKVTYRRRTAVPGKGPANIFDWLGYSRATVIIFSECDIEIYNVRPASMQKLKLPEHGFLDLRFSGMNMHFVRSALHYLRFRKFSSTLCDLLPTHVSDVAFDGIRGEIEALVLDFDNDDVELNSRSIRSIRGKFLVVRKVPKSAEKVLRNALPRILQNFERVFISGPQRSLIDGYKFEDEGQREKVEVIEQ